MFASSIVRSAGRSIGSFIDQLDTEVSDIYNANELGTPWYHDLGVEILNSGTGISIDDAVSEQQD